MFFEEASDGGASAVAGHGRVQALGLEVIEEACDRVGVQVGKLQRGDTAPPTLCDELEQELERIPVGAHRMHARAALARQILGEERLDQGE
jgi:hypothetical protein